MQCFLATLVLLATGASAASELKILFFWTVDSKERTVRLVKQNVDDAFLRGGAGCCEVILGHYQGTPEDWIKQLPQGWYQKHISGNLTRPGIFKYHMLHEAYQQSIGGGRWEQRYEYIWALDSDMKFVGMDYDKFFNMVRATGSAIVSPTFEGPADMWSNTALAEQTSKRIGHHGDISTDSEPGSAVMRKGIHRQQTVHHHKKTRLNPLGKSDSHCAYRHTDFVEMSAPMISRQVFALIFQGLQCPGCMQEAKGEWGLDRVWCELVNRHFLMENHTSCAYIDSTPIKHLDWRSATLDGSFAASVNQVKNSAKSLWSKVEFYSCVKDVPEEAESLVLSARGPAQSATLVGQR